ncbi:hypothetical protein BDW59DRAFT_160762 [Aspergillus cavernicola]|uniref:Fungal-specific transcription factor domain-containing protein n=1 Tax=Aspergillus cavernicola TaxID=176166 RepID=A0ABR4IGI4_9EURO
MDQHIVNFFIHYVIHGRDIPATSVPPHLTTRSLRNISSRGYNDSDTDHTLFILDNNLYQLICRVRALHFRERNEPTPSSTTICRAVELWSELDNWTFNGDLTFLDYHTLHELLVSALFLWIHLMIHSNKLGSDKTQDLVAEGLEKIAEFDGSPQLCAILLVPLFLHGVASVERGNRGVVDAQFSRLEERVDDEDETLRSCRAIVHWTWRRYDSHVTCSWDWADWVEEDLL